MHLRPASPSDLPALKSLYEASVRGLGPKHYSPDQVEAWASFAREDEAFRRRVMGAWTVVAEDETGPVGFATLEKDGELGLLFVRPDRGRRGIGSSLVEAIVAEARSRGLDRIHTAASLFSRPLFIRHGFVEVGRERVTRRGAGFVRVRMQWPA